jgi:hypothetical protein
VTINGASTFDAAVSVMDTPLMRRPTPQEPVVGHRRHVRPEVLEGPPVPEAVAGAVVGMFLVMGLAFIPDWSFLVDFNSRWLVPLLIVGALIGGAISWMLARPKLERMVVEEEQAERRRSAA